MEIKKIRLFVGNSDKSREVENEIRSKLLANNFTLTDNDDFDLGMAIGGDGSFLRMIRDSHFREDSFYVGVNVGTLGFAQDVEYHEIDKFIESIKNNEYFYEEIGFENVKIITSSGVEEVKCLNEVVIRNDNLKTLHMDILVDDVILENFVGDGILISTSFGSTAHNLCYGGTMVYNEFDTLQITPIAPVKNKSYPTLENSLILPSDKVIKIVPGKFNNFLITFDGVSKIYNDVIGIEASIKSHIRLIRKSDYNYIRKINDKFIK